MIPQTILLLQLILVLRIKFYKLIKQFLMCLSVISLLKQICNTKLEHGHGQKQSFIYYGQNRELIIQEQEVAVSMHNYYHIYYHDNIVPITMSAVQSNIYFTIVNHVGKILFVKYCHKMCICAHVGASLQCIAGQFTMFKMCTEWSLTLEGFSWLDIGY